MAGVTVAQYRSDGAAREYMETVRWPKGPVCPHCGAPRQATKLQPRKGVRTHARRGVYKCRACAKQFTVTIGTIFEDSRVPLRKWLFAIHLMCSSPKGISARELMYRLKLGSYRTAWFMARRIRWALEQEPMTELLEGLIETVEQRAPEAFRPVEEILGPTRPRRKKSAN